MSLVINSLRGRQTDEQTHAYCMKESNVKKPGWHTPGIKIVAWLCETTDTHKFKLIPILFSDILLNMADTDT